jgi:uncharacterized protein YjbJ (UPF0337 family)
MENGKWPWQIKNKWKMENGNWKLANGKLANSKWQMANGKWHMANGKWQMANGKWQMANGKWQMELVHRIWDFASGRLGIKHCSAGICVRIYG